LNPEDGIYIEPKVTPFDVSILYFNSPVSDINSVPYFYTEIDEYPNEQDPESTFLWEVKGSDNIDTKTNYPYLLIDRWRAPHQTIYMSQPFREKYVKYGGKILIPENRTLIPLNLIEEETKQFFQDLQNSEQFFIDSNIIEDGSQTANLKIKQEGAKRFVTIFPGIIGPDSSYNTAAVVGFDGKNGTTSFDTNGETNIAEEFIDSSMFIDSPNLPPFEIPDEFLTENMKLKLGEWKSRAKQINELTKEELITKQDLSSEQKLFELLREIESYIRDSGVEYGINHSLNLKLKLTQVFDDNHPFKIFQHIANAVKNGESLTCHPSAFFSHLVTSHVFAGMDYLNLHSYIVGGYVDNNRDKEITANEAHAWVVVSFEKWDGTSKAILIESTPSGNEFQNIDEVDINKLIEQNMNKNLVGLLGLLITLVSINKVFINKVLLPACQNLFFSYTFNS